MKLPLRPAPVSLTLALSLVGAAQAEVTLAPLFTDHAVLQRDKPLPIWGTAEVGEKITVTFAGQTREATGGYDGRWIAILDPLPTSTRGAELTIAGENTIVRHDIVVGEVWLGAGGANMESPVARAAHAEAEIAAANFPLIRHVRIERTVAAAPADSVATSGWQPASPQTAGAFSAVGYFFALSLHRKLEAPDAAGPAVPPYRVPIGIVHAAWGGAPIEAWVSPAALASDPAFAAVRERRAHLRMSAAGDPPPGDPALPAGVFNGMINPLLPYALRGALWYQGESDAARAADYQPPFAATIAAWRSHFGQGDFPFYWVNLANYAPPADGHERGRTFAFLREAQTGTLALPNTAQALAIDLGDPRDLHAVNRQEIGRRLALIARNREYGIPGDDSGPIFASATREGAAMRVRFTHASGGLVAHHRPVQALELAGADRVFHPADGRIEGDTLVVRAIRVREPAAVRYAWTNAPEANLYNGAGLPAGPFRSEKW